MMKRKEERVMRTAVRRKNGLWTYALIWACAAGSRAWAGGNIDLTNKHAWTENAGWANFAPTNGGVTVHYNGTSGYLTGYAWGENIGWIKLGDDSGGPYHNDSATDWGVNLDAASNLSGYAWSENAGWLAFNSTHSTVTVDMATGRLDGDAWGENIGWVRFKGSAPDYNVRTLAFDAQPLGTPNWWLTLFNVTESYDEGDSVPAWKEYLADTDPTNPLSYFHIVSISNLPPAQRFVSFLSSSRRYYTLQSRDSLLVGGWTNVTAQVGIQGAGGLDSLQDTNVTPRQYYRVGVEVSP
jgi:hypothetical protein